MLHWLKELFAGGEIRRLQQELHGANADAQQANDRVAQLESVNRLQQSLLASAGDQVTTLRDQATRLRTTNERLLHIITECLDAASRVDGRVLVTEDALKKIKHRVQQERLLDFTA